VLQQFRDRLSDRAMRGFGVPLRTTETEIDVVEPSAPSVRIGRVFDRNWEVLSPILPAFAIEAVVRRHFERSIPYLVEQNLSRLGAQWEESINGALWGVEKEARRRLDELMATVERLVGSGSKKRTPQLRADLERIEAARESVVAAAAGTWGRPPACQLLALTRWLPPLSITAFAIFPIHCPDRPYTLFRPSGAVPARHPVPQ
jgi:hypothetical protein